MFTPMRRDKALFSREIYQMSPDKLIYHINEYRYKARRAGKKMNIFDDSGVCALKFWAKSSSLTLLANICCFHRGGVLLVETHRGANTDII